MMKKGSKSKELNALLMQIDKIPLDYGTKKQIDISGLDSYSQMVINDFNNLNDYSKKLDFWRRKFWKNIPFAVDTYTAINGLINIFPENEEERILFNKVRIDIITQDFKKSFTSKTIKYKNITYEILINEYFKKRLKVNNIQIYIQKEIARINKEVLDYENNRVALSSVNPDVSIKTNLLLNKFQLTSNYNFEPDLGEKVYSKRDLIEIIIGISAGKYLRFLKDELFKYKQKNKSSVHEGLWNGDLDSLKLLREILIEKKWIAEIEEKEFLNHFLNRRFYKLIDWFVLLTIFIRLFDSLSFAIHPSYLFGKIDCKYPSPTQLSKHFTINGLEMSPKIITQSRSLIKGTHIKREDEIKAIVDKIKLEFKRK